MPEKEIKSSIDRKYLVFALKIIGDFGVTLALPVIVFVLMGNSLDEKYHHSPFFTVLGFILAALVSGKIIYKKSKAYGKQYQDIDK